MLESSDQAKEPTAMPSWNELFKDEQHVWIEPHEGVKELAAQLAGSRNRRILDLGCGAGRHLVYLAHQGFDMYGTDISEVGLARARAWLAKEGLRSNTVLCDMTTIPFPDNIFSGLISVYVIFHNRLGGMRQSIHEIQRVVAPGGWVFLTFQSKRSNRYGRGLRVEPDTYLADTGADAGELHHYSDLTELDRELSGFVIRKIELDEHPTDSQPPGLSSHWHVWMQKLG